MINIILTSTNKGAHLFHGLTVAVIASCRYCQLPSAHGRFHSTGQWDPEAREY